MSKRVLVADDNAFFGESLVDQLKKRGYPDTIWCNNQNECIRYIRSFTYDLIVISVHGQTEGGNGFEFAQRVLAKWPQTRIMFTSNQKSALLIRKAQEMGAVGFIQKDNSELLNEVQHVIQGGTYFNLPSLTSRLSELTPRELEIAEMIGKEMEKSEIASQLGVAIETIRTHRRNIYSKLGINNSVALVKILIQEGFIR